MIFWYIYCKLVNIIYLYNAIFGIFLFLLEFVQYAQFIRVFFYTVIFRKFIFFKVFWIKI